MGIYIEPWSEDASIEIINCIISEVVAEGVYIADGVSYDIRANWFDGCGVQFGTVERWTTRLINEID